MTAIKRTNTVDESHIGQERVRQFCIVVNAIWSSTGAEPI